MRYFELIEKASSFRNGIYVAVRFDEKTQELIGAFQAAHHIPEAVPEHDLHCTVVYSTAPVHWVAKTDLSEHEVTAKAWEIFDTPSGERCLVLLLDSDYLHDRWQLAMDRGAKYDFPEYKPHITLSYDVGDFDIDDLPLFDGEITMNKEYVKPLTDD